MFSQMELPVEIGVGQSGVLQQACVGGVASSAAMKPVDVADEPDVNFTYMYCCVDVYVNVHWSSSADSAGPLNAASCFALVDEPSYRYTKSDPETVLSDENEIVTVELPTNMTAQFMFVV